MANYATDKADDWNFETATKKTEAFKAAAAELRRLTTHTDDCEVNKLKAAGTLRDDGQPAYHYAGDDAHDRCSTSLRDLLLYVDDKLEGLDTYAINQLIETDAQYNNYKYGAAQPDEVRQVARALQTMLDAARYSPWHREEITDIALGHSLCPLHFVDYAICFDDDEESCRSIRIVHPSHDT